MSTPSNESSLRAVFRAVGQEHVFAFWDGLDAGQRQELLSDLSLISVEQLPRLRQIVLGHGAVHAAPGDVQPPTVIRREAVTTEQMQIGRRLLSEGKVAAFTVAGGQGTRLGYDGPKGAFPIGPISHKPLFQLFAEAIIATDRKYGGVTHWYIMTSPQNDAATKAFFDEFRYFGMPADRVHFFTQGVMPAFDRDGRILLDQPHRVALSPDGHGGSLLAMATSGTLADLAARGIEHISYFQVDNPLVKPLDPAFLGLHAASGSEMSSKTLPKADDLERVGNFVMIGGRLAVIEYSDLPEALARRRNADGSRTFDAANIAVHVLSRAFVERLTRDRAAFGLPWHRAEKKVPCIDLNSGQRVEPSAPNAVKLEAFIFDALPLAERAVLMETSRAEEFSPVKNATGVDSVETAKRDISRRAAAWLARAGVAIPRMGDEPDGVFEISPLYALDAEDVAARSPKLTVSPAARVYLE